MRKRKETELEKKLIEKGFKLDHKIYGGKYREKTTAYVYQMELYDITYYVNLDKKRENVECYAFSTKTHKDIFDIGYIHYLDEIMNKLNDLMRDVYHVEEEEVEEIEFHEDDTFINEESYDD